MRAPIFTTILLKVVRASVAIVAANCVRAVHVGDFMISATH